MPSLSKSTRAILTAVTLAVLVALSAVVWWQTAKHRELTVPPQPPKTTLVFGPYVTNVTASSAQVLWACRGGRGSCEVLSGAPQARLVPKRVELDDSVEDALYSASVTGLLPGQTVRYRLTCGEDAVEASFATPPPPPEANGELRFVVYGDSRTNADMHKAVIDGILREPNVAFVVHTGDYTTTGELWDDWKSQFFEPAAELLRRASFWAARGNHEGGGFYFRRLFGRSWERPNVSFDWGDVHVAILDQYRQTDTVPLDGNDLAATIDWLAKDLAATKALWKLVIYHEPTFNLGGHGSQWGREDVLPVLQKAGVDLVLSGHSHLYERFRPIGPKGAKPILFIVTGGGGAPLYSAVESDALEASCACLHYCAFRVAGNELEMTARTPEGETIDQFKLVKTAGLYQKAVMDRAMTEDQEEKAEGAPAR